MPGVCEHRVFRTQRQFNSNIRKKKILYLDAKQYYNILVMFSAEYVFSSRIYKMFDTPKRIQFCFIDVTRSAEIGQ